MSGRINPREYDLGELRDAVREPLRHDGDAGTEDHDGGGPSAPAGRSDAETSAAVSAIEDPETYLRERRKRSRSTPDPRASRRRDAIRKRTPERDDRSRSSSHSTTGRGDRDRFEFLTHRHEGGVSRPYLEALPGAYRAQLEIFEWLDALVSKAGREGAISALEYYESIEWLSAESRGELESFVDGIETKTAGDGSLDIEDHRESLAYVARLSARHR